MSGHRRVYVAVINDAGEVRMGVAVEGEAGYNPIKDETDLGGTYESREDAHRIATDLNAQLGITEVEAAKVVASTMRGR